MINRTSKESNNGTAQRVIRWSVGMLLLLLVLLFNPYWLNMTWHGMNFIILTGLVSFGGMSVLIVIYQILIERAYYDENMRATNESNVSQEEQ